MKAASPVSRRYLLAGLGACVALLAALAPQSSQAAHRTHRTATAPPIIYKGQVAVTQLFTSAAAAYYIGQRLGFYRQAGLDLKFVNFNGGTDTINAIRTMGIGFASTGAGLLGIANGVDVKIVGGGFNTAGEQFIVPANSPLRTINDMRGRVTKIAVSRPGSNTEFEIQGIAKQLHLTLGKDVQIVYIGDINAAWTAAKQGLVDAAYSGPPISTQLVNAREARVWFKASQYFHIPNDVSFATSDFIREHPVVIRRWMQVQRRVNILIRRDPERAANAYAKAAGLEVGVARQALAEYKAAYSTDILKDGIRNIVKVLVAQRSLKSVDQINLDDVIDTRFANVTDFAKKKR